MKAEHTLELFVKSPPISPFSGICKVMKYEMLKQSSRLIKILVQVGAVKISIAAVKALRKKETKDETQFTTKICGKTSLGPNYFLL